MKIPENLIIENIRNNPEITDLVVWHSVMNFAGRYCFKGPACPISRDEQTRLKSSACWQCFRNYMLEQTGLDIDKLPANDSTGNASSQDTGDNTGNA